MRLKRVADMLGGEKKRILVSFSYFLNTSKTQMWHITKTAKADSEGDAGSIQSLISYFSLLHFPFWDETLFFSSVTARVFESGSFSPLTWRPECVMKLLADGKVAPTGKKSRKRKILKYFWDSCSHWTTFLLCKHNFPDCFKNIRVHCATFHLISSGLTWEGDQLPTHLRHPEQGRS